MDYSKIYTNLIDRAKNRILEGYFEKHHVKPCCIGGSNENENIVSLTAREHFLAHWLLYRMYPENKSIIYAFWMMTCRFKNFSSIAYAESREAYIKKRKGFKHSEETIKRISEKRKKQGNTWTGRKHREEVKEKMSLSAKNRNMSDEAKIERNKKMSLSHTGVKKSEDHKKNIAKSKAGNKNPMFGKKAKQVQCTYCKKILGVNMAKRYHFEKCKQYKTCEV